MTLMLTLLTLAASGCASLEPARRISRSTEPPSVFPDPPPTASGPVTPSSQDIEPDNGAVVTVAYVSQPEDAAEVTRKALVASNIAP